MRFFRKYKIYRKIVLYSFFIAIVPLSCTAILVYKLSSQSLKTGIQDKLIAISEGKDALLDRSCAAAYNFLLERSSGPTPVKAFEELAEAFKKFGVGSKEYDLLDAKYRTTFQSYLDVNPYIHDMLFISSKGDIIFTMKREKDLGANIYGPMLKDTQLGGMFDAVNIALSPVFSDYEFYPPSNKPALFIGNPIFGNNMLLGEMVFQINPEFLNAFSQNYVGLGNTGEITFGKKYGDEIIYTVPLRLKPDAALSYKVKVGAVAALPMQKAVRGDTGIGIGKDYRFKDVVARWQYIPQLRWGMVVKQDLDEAFAPIYKIRIIFIIITILLMLMLLWVSFIIAHRIALPIGSIRDGLLKIGSGDFDYRINLTQKDEIGELAGMLNFMAAQLKNSREKLLRSEKLVALGKLAGFVSHELRNPLGVMKNIVYYFNMIELGKDNPEIKENLNMLSAEIERSNKIISDLLEFSRIKKPELRLVDINKALEEALARIGMPDNIEIIKELDYDLPLVETDPLHINQVFYNILINGVEAMGKGGTLILNTANENGNVKISFTDTGIGIPEENLNKIFEPLFSTKTKGSGLGLAICNMLVAETGGHIEVKSKVGKGSTFIIKLPFNRR